MGAEDGEQWGEGGRVYIPLPCDLRGADRGHSRVTQTERGWVCVCAADTSKVRGLQTHGGPDYRTQQPEV